MDRQLRGPLRVALQSLRINNSADIANRIKQMEGPLCVAIPISVEDSEKNKTDFKGLKLSTSKIVKAFWQQLLLFSILMALMIAANYEEKRR